MKGVSTETPVLLDVDLGRVDATWPHVDPDLTLHDMNYYKH